MAEATEVKNMYELTFIVSGVLKEQQTRQAIDRVQKLITDGGGEIIEADEWGSQRLAYKIEKKRTGFYVNVYFTAPGALIPRLERSMTIDDDILRYLTLRMDAKMQRHRERQKKRRVIEEREAAEAEAKAEAEAEAAEAEADDETDDGADDEDEDYDDDDYDDDDEDYDDDDYDE